MPFSNQTMTEGIFFLSCWKCVTESCSLFLGLHVSGYTLRTGLPGICRNEKILACLVYFTLNFCRVKSARSRLSRVNDLRKPSDVNGCGKSWLEIALFLCISGSSHWTAFANCSAVWSKFRNGEKLIMQWKNRVLKIFQPFLCCVMSCVQSSSFNLSLVK